MKKKSSKERLLTEAELEMMNVLWRLSEGTVADVQEALLPHRKLAYTSISTILRILEQKGVLRSRKEGRGHVYIPTVAKESYETTSLRHLIGKVFDGAPSSLVKRLLEEEELSDTELREIRRLLNERLQ
jgi:predicted transcriptional regulator